MTEQANRGGLVGRERELAALDALVASRRRDAALLAIAGEPGIGKTRLLGQLCERAEAAGLLVLDGRAVEFETDRPFAILLDALDPYLASLNPRVFAPLSGPHGAELARVFPSLSELDDEQPAALAGERYQTHEAVRRLLELLAARRPLVLALDDVHWADAATRELLRYLLRRRPRAPVLVALALRPHEAPAALRGPLDEATAEGALTRLDLSPLERAEAAPLLAAEPDPARRELIFEHSGGNPFYIEELVRAGESGSLAARPGREPLPEVPPAVSAALAAELERLPAAVRRLLEGAAVAGEPFEPELAAAAAEVGEAEAFALLDQLVAAGLLGDAGSPRRFRFRHPLVRRTVYELAKPGWRLGAHGRVAAALRDLGAGASARAYHVEQSARPGDEAAIATLTEAGTAAAPRAPASAARWLSSALRLLPEGDEPRRLALLVPRAMALAAAGELAQSRETMLELLARLGPEAGGARVRVLAVLAAVEHLLGRHEEAGARLRRALDDLDQRGTADEAALQLELAVDALYRTEWEPMRERARRALEVADAVGEHALSVAAAALLGYGLTTPELVADARRHADRAAATLDRLDDADLAACLAAPYYLGFCEFFLERYADSLRHLDRGIEVSRATGQGQFVIQMQIGRAWALLLLGELELASEAAQAAAEGSRLIDNAQGLSWALWAQCVVERVRDPRRAREIYLESVELGRGLDRSILSDAGRAQHALVLVELGEHEAAVAELEAAGAPDFSDFEARQRGFFSEALVRCALALGRREQAEELSERVVEDARDLGLPVVAGVTMRARATVLATRGDRASAAEGAQMAIEAAEAQAAQGARIDAARSRIVAGRALVGAGDREAAERELETALRALEECGARHHRDEAAAELRALGRRVARRLGAAPAGEGALAALSPRELEVARLVAEGGTNKLVAEQLFLSERTVEGHLSRSFEKLGISSRVELARMVLGR